jgi:iron complex transport system substrate-binding protein
VEAVIAVDPEVIVASGMGDSRPEWLDDWRRWKTLAAVARDNLYFVPPDLLQRHTPRILDGAEKLCAHLEAARGKRGK